ncbi:MAG: LysR family transcriptional regulator [Acetobacter sp.]|nr:LysR family transcriptional regulator [Bacteroides sp.]MCM1341103.1 LysR family transcriptional regulator [Acetobacter sp.]MCM1433564.1 LysR family transcriptional regulator [Clostridiales bacterium]
MDIRVLEYFLAVAREQSISGAADYLHLTQPTLSRQLMDLENELGKQLFIRGNRKIILTDDGIFLRKRAEEIVELLHKTENEIKTSDKQISGDVYIGAGETDGVRFLAKTAKDIQKEHPDIHYHISSGDGLDVLYNLNKGIIDFALVLSNIDTKNYDYIKLPAYDKWGVLMKNDSELSDKEYISPEDLYDKPLIVSRQSYKRNELKDFFKGRFQKLNIIATYNLIYNAALMVDEGLGYALTLDKLVNTSNTNMKFIPLNPQIDIEMYLAWKKYQVFSKPARLFLDSIRERTEQNQ